MIITLKDEQATLALGALFAQFCPADEGFIIHLEGELGAGKTTLTRGLLRHLGYQGHVKSPTYTLVERYDLTDRLVFHFDLYRLASAEELDFIGIEDYLSCDALCIIEWANKGNGYLAPADLEVRIDYNDNARQVKISAYSDSGTHVITHLKKSI